MSRIETLPSVQLCQTQGQPFLNAQRGWSMLLNTHPGGLCSLRIFFIFKRPIGKRPQIHLKILYGNLYGCPPCAGGYCRGVAEAHRLDMALQEAHGCKCMTNWIDVERETVFCLIEAPSKDAVQEMHLKVHGLIPHKIIEVQPGIVQSILGRIHDPEGSGLQDGLKVFKEPSFRTLLVIKVSDPVLLHHNWGNDKASTGINARNELPKRYVTAFEGPEIEHEDKGLIASFVSATKAVSSALAIQNRLQNNFGNPHILRIGIDAVLGDSPGAKCRILPES